MIDCREDFASKRPTHSDAAILNRLEVEGMQWLSAFEHHVVGDIDNGIDALNADCSQSINEPLWTRSNAHAANHTRRVKRAEGLVVNLNSDATGSITFAFKRSWVRGRKWP